MKVDKAALKYLPGHDRFRCPGLLEQLLNLEETHEKNPAIGGVERAWMSHGELKSFIREKTGTLLNAGIGRGDIVMACLPDGPEALTALLVLSSITTVLPVSPEEPKASLKELINRVPFTAIFFDAKHSDVFENLTDYYALTGIPFFIDSKKAAGAWEFVTPPSPATAPSCKTDTCDAAILVRSAGSTAEPKIIAWSQTSIIYSAKTIANWMELTTQDRSLCMMPFSHLHSLVRSTLPGLLSGGSVVCAPGFDRFKVLSWINEYAPTYMTAVPAIYRAMLEQVLDKNGINTTLRFLASGSDRIDVSTVEALHATFKVPIQEFYGMSEVSPMLAATKSGELAQTNGSVGSPVTPWDIRIWDDSDNQVPARNPGRIVVRGGMLNPVLSGDDISKDYNEAAWHVTGDVGYLNTDGNLIVTGRVDDRINRGGKKIAPEAIEATLRLHDEVSEAVVFPFSDPLLGQRVAAAIVPKQENTPDVKLLRGYLARNHPEYMVPERVLLVDTLPVNRVGKLSRNQIAATLLNNEEDLTESRGRITALGPTETKVAEMFREALESDTIEMEKDFSDLGGDSFQATVMLAEIEDRFGVSLTPAQFIENSSVSELASLLDKGKVIDDDIFIRTIRQGDNTCPIFIAHSVTGYTDYAYTIANSLQYDQTVFLLQWQSPKKEHQHESLEAYATRFLEPVLKRLSPGQPFALAGHSFGAQLAYEIGQQLLKKVFKPSMIILIDDEADLHKRRFGIRKDIQPKARILLQCRQLLHSYVPKPYPGALLYLQAERINPDQLADSYCGWNDLSPGNCIRIQTPGDHTSMLEASNIGQWAPLIESEMRPFINQASKPLIPISNGNGTLTAQHHIKTVASDDLYLPARIAAKDGQLDLEINNYAQAFKQSNSHPYWVYLNYAEALWQSGEKEKALQFYHKSIAAQTVSTEGYRILINRLSEMGRTKVIATEVDNAVRQTPPESCTGKIVLAMIFKKVGRAEEAMQQLHEVLELEADHTLAMVKLSEWLEASHKYEEALVYLPRLLRKTGADTKFHIRYANLLQKLGRKEEAKQAMRPVIARLRQAVREDSDMLYNQVLLCIALEKAGDRSEATIVFEKAMLNLPTASDASEMLRSVWRKQEGNFLVSNSMIRRQFWVLSTFARFPFARSILRTLFFKLLPSHM